MIEVRHGDSRDVLREIPDDTFDACVCDPPYALISIVKRFGKPGAAPAGGDVYARASAGFMGKTWDTGETAFSPAFWAEVLRVLKPGAHLIACGGTKTYHRLACAIEDAGFEIRDMTAWLYGSGFPKSHDVPKAIDRAMGAEGTYGEPKSAAHAGWIERGQMRGEGGHEGYQRPWMDDPEAVSNAARVYLAASDEAAEWDGWGTALKPALEPICLARKPLIGTVAANVMTHGTGALNIAACRIEADEGRSSFVRAAKPDRDDGYRMDTGGATQYVPAAAGRWPANVLHDGSDEVLAAFPDAPGAQAPVTGREASSPFSNVYGTMARSVSSEPRGDLGSAARFYYSAKANADDRHGSDHPTVKPIDLMRWLCALVTPPGGHILDPFAGTGTTGLAAMIGGFDCTLIEREEPYVQDIRRRLAWAQGEGGLTAQEKARPRKPKPRPKGEPELF